MERKLARSLVASRTKNLSESVIREMTRMADKHGALNLAQGFPDFAAPEVIKVAAIDAIKADDNQYSVTWGSPKLRKAICDKAEWFNGIQAEPDKNVTVTCGSTEAMMATIMALTETGDEVIIFEPAYENYKPSAVFAGATPRPVILGPKFTVEEEALKNAFSSRTKVVIINTPHNPSGKVITEEELKLIGDLCEDYDAVAVTDEIYEHILYGGRKHVSLATVGDMANRTVTISGISKTYTVTGWRIGYTIAEEKITNAIRKVHDYMTVCAPAPLQEAAAQALALPRSFYSELAESYEKKRSLIVDGLRKVGFEFFEPEGAYYILADFGRLSNKNDVDFAKSMTIDAKVASVPGSSFYSDGEHGRNQVRFSYSKKESTLVRAVDQMERYFTTKA